VTGTRRWKWRGAALAGLCGLVIGSPATSTHADSGRCTGRPHYVQQVIDDGATHLWCFDEPKSRAAFVDSIGGPASAFVISSDDGLTFKSPGLRRGSTAIQSRLFDPQDRYYTVRAAIVDENGRIDLTPPFSLELWVRVNVEPSTAPGAHTEEYGTIIGNDNGAGLYLNIFPSEAEPFYGGIRVAFWPGIGGCYVPASELLPGQTYHVVFVVDTSFGMHWFVNGAEQPLVVLYPSDDFTEHWNPALVLGPLDRLFSEAYGDRNPPAALEDLAFYPRALAPYEVSQHFLMP
jgi:Concanavalin A-like lectin/glucanases superfamily